MTREEQIVEFAKSLGYANGSFGYDLIAKTVKWADSHPAWVSIEEGLPEENGKTQQSISIWATDGLISGEFRYNFDTKTWTDMWGDPFDITHWMSLPPLPRKEE